MKVVKYYLLFFVFFIIAAASAFCQSNYFLKIVDLETDSTINYVYRSSFETVLDRENEIKNLSNHYYKNGFLTFSIDSIFEDSINKVLFVSKGLSYQWVNLNVNTIDDNLLKKAGYKRKYFDGNYLSIEKLNKLKDNIITQCENNGYPFAEVKLDSIISIDGKINASLNLSLNNLILFDSIVLKGNSKIKSSFLNNYLGIKKDDFYNEFIFSNIDKQLKDLSFIKLKNPTSIGFSENYCYLYIDALKKNASSFDGILGIIPDNITGKVVLTGDVKLKLVNSFGTAESIGFNWKRLAENTQRLKADFAYPYIFNSRLGLEYFIDILQKDTTYVSVKHNGSLKYLYDKFDYLSLTGEFFKSSLLSTANFNALSKLPDFADVSSVLLGMGFHKENLDFRLNPSKGFIIDMQLAAGNRTISKHPLLNEALYNGIDLNSKQYKYDLMASAFISPFQKNVLMFTFKGGKLFANNLFQNELYRLGGSYLLRGFDEESIYASLYSLFTLEYRYLIQSLSYINLFFDGCYYENYSINNNIIDRPYGFGAGFTFETKQGVFSLSYALGKQFDNPIQFKSGKVHLGYVSFF